VTKLLAKDGEGERLDRFELIAELASGGMATVFLARLSGVAGFQRLVAIKRLHPHLAREPEFVEMFLDEARLAARIHHPNVVPIQEVGESDQGYYLVMDYIEGDTLARVLAKAAKAQTTVPYGVTIRILLDVLAGLHAAHQMKDDHGVPLEIVHRDVSPQNILVGVDGVARVVDFGVARAASRLSTTRSGQLKGKLAYMAPEQARGGVIDRRADLFSCGIVLWEALATKRLFKGDGEAETLNRVLYDAILPPSSVRPDVPKALEIVCMKALSREVDQRFANAQEFGDELEKAARALSCVGSVRDVSQCLEEVMGVDLSQQRDAVRAWLARSEPSHGSAPRSRPMLDSIVTRVDGASKSEPSDRSSRRAPPTSERASAPPEKVSSVSSAVIQVPDASSTTGPTSAGAPAPARSRPARVALALVAAIILVGVGAWGARSYTARVNDAGTTANAATPAPPTATAPVASGHEAPALKPADPSAPASAAAATASAAPASSSAPSARPIGAAKPVGRPPVRPTGSAKPPTTVTTPSASGVPDDLSRNPYR
jgi:eukaryotic-like serine/threonine-protein kinase